MCLLMDISQENEKNHKEETFNNKVKLESWQNRSFTLYPDTNTAFDSHTWVRVSLWEARSLAERLQQILKTRHVTEA